MTSIMPRLRVGVVLGGRSNEKEISLESGRNVIHKLPSEKYEVIPLYLSNKLRLHRLPPHLLVRNRTADIESECDHIPVVKLSDLRDTIDFAFLALHGDVGENGTLQGVLELLAIPYNGSSVAASAICMDKLLTKTIVQQVGCDVARGIAVMRDEWEKSQESIIKRIQSELPVNVIVKPHDDGCSLGVSAAQTAEEITSALNEIFALGKTKALVEEQIFGTEVSIGVIGNNQPHAFEPTETLATKSVLSIEEKFLPGAGENLTPARLPDSARLFIRQQAEKAYEAVACCGYARIDSFYQSAEQSPTGVQRLVILEINSLPALTPATCIFHQAAEENMSPKIFLELIIALGIERHAPQKFAEFSWLQFMLEKTKQGFISTTQINSVPEYINASV